MQQINQLFDTSSFILMEGAIAERVKREFQLPFDPFINHAGMIYFPEGKQVLTYIYKQYISIAIKHQIPILITTPTRRADEERIGKSVFAGKDVLVDNYQFLNEVRLSFKQENNRIFIGGLMGCHGNPYTGGEGLGFGAGLRHHRNTVEKFVETGVDFIMACAMPSIEECRALAYLLAKSPKSFIISFMINEGGTLLDGTPISSAIQDIDQLTAGHSPLIYMVNCIHPLKMILALNADVNDKAVLRKRLKGFQANTSLKPPHELDCLASTAEDDPELLMSAMKQLKSKFGFQLMGGCCGTTNIHIKKIAELNDL